MNAQQRTVAKHVLRPRLAEVLATPEHLLFAPTRQRRDIAERRALGMYLAGITLNLGYRETGRLFGRDRTTVRHAMRRVEDMRDDRNFDALCNKLEHDLRFAVNSNGELQ